MDRIEHNYADSRHAIKARKKLKIQIYLLMKTSEGMKFFLYDIGSIDF